VFYVPGADRKLAQTGEPGHYTFVEGTPEPHAIVAAETRRVCAEAYHHITVTASSLMITVASRRRQTGARPPHHHHARTAG